MSAVEIEPNKDPRMFGHNNPTKKVMQKSYEQRHKDVEDSVGPTKPWLPSKQGKLAKPSKPGELAKPSKPGKLAKPSKPGELAKKRNPRAPRSPEKTESAQDLYEKAKKQHEEEAAAKEEEQTNSDGEEHGSGGGGFNIDLGGGSKGERDVTAYTRFFGGPHSIFQMRKEQGQYKSEEEE